MVRFTQAEVNGYFLQQLSQNVEGFNTLSKEDQVCYLLDALAQMTDINELSKIVLSQISTGKSF
jgi:hypothetical protein